MKENTFKSFRWYHSLIKQGSGSATVTIPQPIIATLGLETGDHLEIQLKKDKIVMTKF
jgi:antitoxin component of MazEF toxin-antitoxin module